MQPVNKPRVWWVFPGNLQIPASVIDAPPDIWQDKITSAKVAPEFRKQFVKVMEVISDHLDVSLD